MLNIVNARRAVVKVGTSTITYENGRPNLQRIERLVRVLSDFRSRGIDVALVTSGAISVGLSKLGLEKRPEEMAKKQAAAAVGQCELMFLYDRLFNEYGHTAAQVLLTRDVVDTDQKRENVLSTLDALFSMGVIPVVNENDTVSTDEIDHRGVFGDNDTLSAIVASIIRADILILLSDIDGLYDKDPAVNADAKLIPVVYAIDDELRNVGGGAGTDRGTGGMATKIAAAELATENGVCMVIANGEDPDILRDIMDGRIRGTVFLPRKHRDARNRPAAPVRSSGHTV